MSSEASSASVEAMIKSMYVSDKTEVFEVCTFGECVATFDLAERFGLSDLKEAARRASGPAGERPRLGADVGESMKLVPNVRSAGVSALVDNSLLKRMPEFVAEEDNDTLQRLEGRDKIRWLDMLERRSTVDSTAISPGEDSVFKDSPNHSCVTKAARAMVDLESNLKKVFVIVRPTTKKKKRKRTAQNGIIGIPSTSSPADGSPFLDASASV
ncbi:hypothetical protein TI39_contig447g00012 [Zymoseptoria brevis]|uniref:Uncharacterized protein n=1 Tax=Zymoseptoria brevis TaxID=1047168 RepID=A0A0F4GKQ4_9PEZI|nr:hypothetical protein TI39_contig447g00012 [Zymoseptoria brevis]